MAAEHLEMQSWADYPKSCSIGNVPTDNGSSRYTGSGASRYTGSGIWDPGSGIPRVPRVCVPWVLWSADLVGALECGSGGEQDGNSAAETIQLFFRVRESLSEGALSGGPKCGGLIGWGHKCGALP